MPFELDRHRAALLLFTLGSRTKDGRPTTEDLCSAVGISAGHLRTPSEHSAHTQERIAQAEARLLDVDPSQWMAWLMGHDEPSIAAFVASYGERIRCICGKWFLLKHAKIRRCDECQAKAQQVNSFSYRLAKDAGLRAWYDALHDALPAASKKDPVLCRLIAQIVAERRAVKRSELAEQLKIPRLQLDARWKAAGLPPKGGPEHKSRRNAAISTCSWRQRTRRAGSSRLPMQNGREPRNKKNTPSAGNRRSAQSLLVYSSPSATVA